MSVNDGDQAEAKAKLVSVLDAMDESDASEQPQTVAAAASTPTGTRRNGIDHILNDADAEPARVALTSAHDEETKPAATIPATGQKRKRAAEDASPAAAQGFFVRVLVLHVCVCVCS